MKTLVDAQSDRILGFTALGADAGELIAAVQVAMLAGQPYTLVRDAIFTHPTMSEGRPLCGCAATGAGEA